MSVSLSLKSRRQGEKPPIESGHYILQGELEWLLSGDHEQLIEIKQSLPGIAERLSADLLLLDFGNAVGFFTVPFLGRIEVISGKWGRQASIACSWSLPKSRRAYRSPAA